MSKSIKTKIILQFSSLLAISMLLMIVFVTYMITSNMKVQAELSLENRAASIETKIENRLDYLVEHTKLLAKHDLMINALIDEEGKKAYLTPLVKNFIEDKDVVTLNVVDFDGKAIFKTQENILKYSESLHLRRSLATGDTTYYLNKSNNKLIVISPIKYYNTTQGSLIAEYSFKKIIDKYKPNDNSVYIKLFKNSIVSYSYNFDEGKKYYSYKLTSNITPIFNKLGIVLEMGILESIYLAPIKDAMIKLSLLGLIVLVIGILISYFLANSITNPILKLYNRVRQKKESDSYEPLGTNDELETLSTAFYNKTKKLQDSEKIYANLYNNSPDMYISIEANSAKIITCNKTLVDKLGYSKDEIVGKEIFELYHSDCNDDLHRVLDSFETEGVINNEELQLKRKDGTKIYVLFSLSVVRDSSGIILHSHSTMRDITQIKEHEQQMKDNERLLFQQSKMAAMGEMIGNIAHQWRQPLSAISISSANMRASVELEEEITNDDIINFSKNIEHQCQYLSRTIDDFKNFFAPNRKKSEFSIQHSIDKTMGLVAASLKTHEIEVIEDIEDIKIKALENELTQAILNIIKNAKDILLMLEDKKRLIFIKAYKKDKIAFLDIIDSGGGVPKEIINKVFEPYFTTKDKNRGTGIGLYMTQSIVTRHLNGKIYVENVEYEHEGEQYKGAKFTIEIPLVDTPK